MKPLKPSHRKKKRYLLIEGRDVSKNNIDDAILEFIGVLGFASANPVFVKTGNNKKEYDEKIILEIERKSLDKIRASFLLSGKDIKIVRVSGSVGKLK